MTKKHFIALADAIHRRQSFGTDIFSQSQIVFLADFLGTQNPRFNRKRWIGYIRGENGPNGEKVK